VICAWDLGLDLNNTLEPASDFKPPPTAFRQQVQAHTHWINDIALCQSNQALLSASSDITVKLWRPSATDGMPPQSIGLHSDYVKTLAVPSQTSDWVASGGLDRKICLWDLNGGGQKLCIDVGEDEAGSLTAKEKGSVYALAATNNVLCSGGPESTVRVWDSRTGKRITKLVGHTDNIRDVLVSQDGSTILTASSDRTVKVWSTVAGRCMYTLTMHDSSVWSLCSQDPDLSVFYSTDKNGMVAKTDTRNTIELDEGLSVALCQEHEGVHKVKAAGGYVWTATSRPSINRWADLDTTDAEIEIPDNYTHKPHRSSVSTATMRYPSSPEQKEIGQIPNGLTRKIPLKHMLRLSNAAYFPTLVAPENEMNDAVTATSRRISAVDKAGQDTVVSQPVRDQPDYAIEGQNGLIKHVMLNDRRRVLTLDTAGEVIMWDLLKCVPVKSFGKRHIEDVQAEVATNATVANWCQVDTRTGSVTVVLEENNCFDAEMYADELDLDEDIDFRDDQRINLGKWVLRYLFSNLITEQIERDQVHRSQLLNAREQQKMSRENAPGSIQMPDNHLSEGWQVLDSGPPSASTVKPTNGYTTVQTPGLAIGLSTPGVGMASPAVTRTVAGAQAASDAGSEGAPLDRTVSQSSRKSTDRHSDYFSTSRIASSEITSPGGPRLPVTPGEGNEPTTPSEGAAQKDTPSKGGLFGKKFGMGSMSFSGMKKMGRQPQAADKDKPVIVEEKDETDDSRSSKTDNSRVVDDNLLGTVQKIRFAYEDSLNSQLQSQVARDNGLPVAIRPLELPTAITPSLPAETPVLKPPLNTTILIQEDRPEAGGVADLFEGTVGALGELCDAVERAAPMWLGEVLLRNQIPHKDISKISFVLEPWQSDGAGADSDKHVLLPSIAADGNNRLNANRMLRAKKILAYVAERIEPGLDDEKDKEGALKPEEYLELWCHSQVSDTIYMYYIHRENANVRTPDRPCQHDPSHYPFLHVARRRRRPALLQVQRPQKNQAHPCCVFSAIATATRNSTSFEPSILAASTGSAGRS
jgi:WD repeat-containing protein 48